ncbi:MAG: helix-turn-helix domain-containing protein [Alphaproteobacteria bacterium]|jgi:excisionase family DNA binding protein|nr:helix-turn-helix domain-containing protein [Alphaproteobacteria bacterium]
MQNPELLTITQLCEAVNIGRTNAYRLIGEGKIKAIKINRKTLIRRSDMDAWIESLPAYTGEV